MGMSFSSLVLSLLSFTFFFLLHIMYFSYFLKVSFSHYERLVMSTV